MTLREWEAAHGPEAKRRHRALRESQRKVERGLSTYAEHMARCSEMEQWLGDTNWLDAYEVSKHGNVG